MAIVAPPAVTALPTPPSTTDIANFDADGDAFLGAFPAFRTQLIALGGNVFDNATDAHTSAVAAAGSVTSATTQAGLAAASAVSAVVAAGAVLWVSGTTYAQYANVISPADARTYRRKTASGSGTTDPSTDTTNYVLISNFAYAQTADQTITLAGALTIAHGLGRAPLIYQAYLKNLTAEGGYSPGDIVQTPLAAGYNGGGSGGMNAATTMDATNIYVRFGASGFQVLNKTSGINSILTPANWAFFVRAFA